MVPGDNWKNFMFDQDDLNVPIYIKSPFYQDFLTIKMEVPIQDCDAYQLYGKNPYYCPAYLEDFLKKDVPYISLWSGLLNNGMRYSNQSIEGYIGKIKKEMDDCSISLGQRPIPPRKFFQFSNERTKELGNKFLHNLGNSQLSNMPNKLRKDLDVSTLDTLTSKENWKGQGDGPRAKFSYLESRNLKKIDIENNLELTHGESISCTDFWKGESRGKLQEQRNSPNLTSKKRYLNTKKKNILPAQNTANSTTERTMKKNKYKGEQL